MEDFKISLDHKDNRTQIISSYKIDLFIAVKNNLDRVGANDNAFRAKLSDGPDIYFIVLYPELDPEFKKWSFDLFFEAILFYFEEQYGHAPEGVSVVNDVAFYPYQVGPDGEKNTNTTPLTDEEYNNFLNGKSF